ncbi:MAG: HAD family hydrolase [Tepidiformaceae bacterium]
MKALLWDLDDTLLNTLPARMDALETAYKACFGTTVDALALWRSHRGGTLEALGQRLMGDDWRTFVTAYRDVYYAIPDRGVAFPGVEEVLAEVEAAEIPMAVVTSKISHGAIEELARAGVLRYFHAVVAFDDTDEHKPDPAPIYEALDRIVLDPGADVVFIGDSPADVFAARNAGCWSIGALWGTLDEELLRDATPDQIAARPSEVPLLLLERAGILR